MTEPELGSLILQRVRYERVDSGGNPRMPVDGSMDILPIPTLALSYKPKKVPKLTIAGGIWAPLVGTFYLVIGSLLFVAPVGILAAIYLNEYAKEGWLNRVITVATGHRLPTGPIYQVFEIL